MCVVTPSIRLLGTAASAIQRKRRQPEMAPTSASWPWSSGSRLMDFGARSLLDASLPWLGGGSGSRDGGAARAEGVASGVAIGGPETVATFPVGSQTVQAE